MNTIGRRTEYARQVNKTERKEMECADLQQRVYNKETRQELFHQTQMRILHTQQVTLNRLDDNEKLLKPHHSTQYHSRAMSWQDDLEHDYGASNHYFPSRPVQSLPVAPPIGNSSTDDVAAFHPFVPPTYTQNYQPSSRNISISSPSNSQAVQPRLPSSPSNAQAVQPRLPSSYSNAQAVQPRLLGTSFGPEPLPIKFVGHSLPSSEVPKDKLHDPEAFLPSTLSFVANQGLASFL